MYIYWRYTLKDEYILLHKMISIVIPTWNEERYLPNLLRCIKKQTFKDYEIIIADADSTDKTKEIAKKNGCRIINGGMPSAGRNNGAKVAKGELIAFFDADVKFDDNFLRKSVEEITMRKIDVAGVQIIPQTDRLIDILFLKIFNCLLNFVQYFYPSAYGGGLFCKKELHKKVNGFDEKIILGEDIDYVQRCSKYGKFRILKNDKIYFCMRRFEKNGRWKTAIKHTLSAVYRIIFGQIRKNIFKYEMRWDR